MTTAIIIYISLGLLYSLWKIPAINSTIDKVIKDFNWLYSESFLTFFTCIIVIILNLFNWPYYLYNDFTDNEEEDNNKPTK